MPEFAQFVSIRDTTFILPDPTTGLNDMHIQGIDFADLDPRRTAVLYFRVNVYRPLRLTMRFNSNAHLIDYNFDPPEPLSTRPRTWHEVFPGSDLQPAGNELVIAVSEQAPAAGTATANGVELSDIVVLYHART